MVSRVLLGAREWALASPSQPHTRHPSSVTNGGKTTLTNGLLKALPNCCVIHQDDFFKVTIWDAGVGGMWGMGFSSALSVPKINPLGREPVKLTQAECWPDWHAGMILHKTSYTSAFPSVQWALREEW